MSQFNNNHHSSIVLELKDSWEAFCEEELHLTRDMIAKTWLLLESMYSEPIRVYHTLEHIYDLFQILQPYKSTIKDLNTVILAIFFHDIIYDPKSNMNEEKSANLFSEVLSTYLDKNLVDKVIQYIIATKEHNVTDSQDEDLRIFIDIDMSILGRERDVYAMYAEKIRREYSHVGERAFSSGRSGFLKKILVSEEHIFCTTEFYNKMEHQARSNIEWEVIKLQNILKSSPTDSV